MIVLIVHMHRTKAGWIASIVDGLVSSPTALDCVPKNVRAVNMADGLAGTLLARESYECVALLFEQSYFLDGTVGLEVRTNEVFTHLGTIAEVNRGICLSCTIPDFVEIETGGCGFLTVL